MTETHQNMVSVIYNETVYNLIDIPAKDSQVVKEKIKRFENQLNVEWFIKTKMLDLGPLVQLAYFGVVDHAGLQREVRPVLGDVSDLCDSIIQALNGVKRSLHGALIRIQTAYEYLENSSEANALQILNGLKLILKKLSVDSNSSSQEESKETEQLSSDSDLSSQEESEEEAIKKKKLSLSQKCWKKAKLLLQIHHEAEKEKEAVEDEARKQVQELSANKIEKFVCGFLMRKSSKIILEENKKIDGFKETKEKISKDKAKCKETYDKDLENATKKCKEELNKLKSKYDSDCAKLNKKKPNKLDKEINKSETISAASIKSADDKLMQEKSSQHDRLVAGHQGKIKQSLNKQKISKNHQPIQSSDHKETKKKTSGTDIEDPEMKNSCSAEQTESSSLSINDSIEPQLIAAKANIKLEDTQRPQKAISHIIATENSNMDILTPLCQDESTKAVSIKEMPINEKEKVVTDENKISSTATSNNKDKKSTIKGEELTLKKQQEALLKEYLNNKQQIEKVKTDIHIKYQADIKELDKQLETLNQKLTASKKTIKDSEQKIKEIQQKIPVLSKIIAKKEEVKELNNTKIDCICHSIAALYNVGSIMKQLGNFLEDFTALCHQLNDRTLFRQIKYLQNRKELWKSSAFKLVMLNCYGNYVAFTSVCTVAVECMTKAQEEVYRNISKNLSRDEAFKLVQQNADIVQQVEL